MARVKLNPQQLVNALISTLLSNSKKGKSCDISITEIDEVERKLQVAASVLRGLRNSLQPINKLPPEILAEIFVETKQNLPSFLPLVKGGIRSFDNHSWLTLIHVCRHWRGVVASFPALWGTIDNLRGGVKSEICLKRSRSAPLDVFLSITGPEFAPISPELVEALIPHISRLRQLHVNTDGWFSPTPIYQSFRVSAPLLYSLSIVTKGRDVVGGVLPPIFNDDMPSLRQLTLEHFTSWPAGYFVNLTHLCLFDQSNDTPVSRPTTSQFLDFLESSPALEELAIVRAGPTRHVDDDIPRVYPRNRQVTLSHLREISLGDWSSMTALSRFLSHLTLPSTTQMYIWGQRFPSSSGATGTGDQLEARDLASWMPGDISNLSPLLNLTEIWITRMPETWARGECPFVAILNNALYLWGFYSTSEIRPLAERLPLGNIERLQVRDCFPHPERLTSGMWMEFFEKMVRLQSLTILARDCPVVTRTVLGTLHPKRGHAETAEAPLIESKILLEPGKAETRSKSTPGRPPAEDDEGNSFTPDTPVLVAPVEASSSSKRMTFSKGKDITFSTQEETIPCPLLTHIRIEDNPHIPTLFISSLAKSRARHGSPLKKLEVMYLDPALNKPPRLSSASSSTSSGSGDGHSQGNDSDEDNDSVDAEHQGFTQSDYRLLSKHIDEVVVDISKEKLAEVGPPEWPNQAFRWTLPTRVPPP
ncbi:hypothetical protein PM082_014670 [Marasmius tenuissimus]|nr:hypothetical protein PM082_014670 [Marasmius tenuissimus]